MGAGLQIVDVLQGVPVNVSAQLIMNLVCCYTYLLGKTNIILAVWFQRDWLLQVWCFRRRDCDSHLVRDVLVLFGFIAGFGIALIAIVWLNVRERR